MIDGFITNWILLAGIFLLALASPGPDLVMVVRNALLHSRRAGLWTAAGFALGVGIHVTYTLAGLATVIAHSVVLFNLIKYAGAAYLIYVGIKSLRSSGFTSDVSVHGPQTTSLSDMQALRAGFLTNLLNPKATIFFMAVFSQFITESTPLIVQILYAGTCIAMTFLWFSCVAFFLTQSRIRIMFLSASQWIDRLCGGFLVALGIKLALTKGASLTS